MKANRREFMKFLGLGAASCILPSSASAKKVPHLVVVGGGFAGATCAKYLKLWGGSSVDVTIIEPNNTYVSPILSNLVLNGKKTTGELSFTYEKFKANYQINMVHKSVTSLDSANKTLTLSDASSMRYDKLILATGIDFIQSNAYDFKKVPHAWQAGEQTNLLKTQIESMQDADSFVMSIPKAPYRCPPGPYERACVVADYLKNTKGFVNAKVIVLDENADIIVEKNTFSTIFAKHGIEYIANAKVTQVNDVTKAVSYIKNGVSTTLTPKVLNVIPNQKAAPLIFSAGLNAGNWAPVDPINYASSIKKDIYIIGDSQDTAQPKAGHIGNAEAKICADAILRELNNKTIEQNPKTNSACYSPVSGNEATWLTAVYRYDAVSKSMVLANTQVYPAAGTPSTRNYNDMFMWAGNLFSDTFS